MLARLGEAIWAWEGEGRRGWHWPPFHVVLYVVNSRGRRKEEGGRGEMGKEVQFRVTLGRQKVKYENEENDI